MDEQYCPVCHLVHNDLKAFCCNCDGELITRPDSSNGADKTCHCVDQNEMS